MKDDIDFERTQYENEGTGNWCGAEKETEKRMKSRVPLSLSPRSVFGVSTQFFLLFFFVWFSSVFFQQASLLSIYQHPPFLSKCLLDHQTLSTSSSLPPFLPSSLLALLLLLLFLHPCPHSIRMMVILTAKAGPLTCGAGRWGHCKGRKGGREGGREGGKLSWRAGIILTK